VQQLVLQQALVSHSYLLLRMKGTQYLLALVLRLMLMFRVRAILQGLKFPL
jgi:hypothetical protein